MTGIGGSLGTPDYYNQCATASFVSVPSNYFGYQIAHSGFAYAGLLLWINAPDSREYIEVPLTSTLLTDSCYHFEMYVNLANSSYFTTDNMGVYFSNTAITGITTYVNLPYIPQIINNSGNVFDTLNWTLVSGDYTALGGESHLIIGNFKDDFHTDTVLYNSSALWYQSYVLIDDVSLIPFSPCNTGINANYENPEISIYPNPFSDQVNISLNTFEFAEIIIYDITSRKLIHQSFSNLTTLNTEQLIKGIYLYEIRFANGFYKKGKLVKN